MGRTTCSYLQYQTQFTAAFCSLHLHARQKVVCFLACNFGKSEGNLFWKSAATGIFLMKHAMSLRCYRWVSKNRQLGNPLFIIALHVICNSTFGIGITYLYMQALHIESIPTLYQQIFLMYMSISYIVCQSSNSIPGTLYMHWYLIMSCFPVVLFGYIQIRILCLL